MKKHVSASRKTTSFANFKPNLSGFKSSSMLEWILPNGIGGYSSSTVVGMNTSLYHGILVSSDRHLNQKVFLQKLDEEIITDEESISIATDLYEGDNVLDGWRFLHNFDLNYSSVYFDYSVLGVNISRTITPMHGRNAVVIHYSVHNRLRDAVRLKVTPSMNIRPVGMKGKKSLEDMIPVIYSENIAGIDSLNGYLALSSDRAGCSKILKEERWGRKIMYPKDGSSEYLCSPVYFSLDVEPDDAEDFCITAVGYGSEDETAAALKELLNSPREKNKPTRFVSSGKGGSILSLLNSVDDFIIPAGSKKTIVSSYPYSMEKGREAMISLPGFTLINHRYGDAELILERYLNDVDYRGIAALYRDGKPEYGDVDTALWLIDRFHKYVTAVGGEKAKGILHTYYWVLKDIIKRYMGKEKDGMLRHKGGTWMDPGYIKKKRVDAVEVQGLWYNALRVMEEFRALMEDDSGEEGYLHVCKKFEDNFMDRYWTGGYLADSGGDDSLRPNQVILLSMDFNVVNKTLSKKILHAVGRELLTDYGLRTLTPEDPRYVGGWDGDLKNKFNGNVYPWLIGPYIKAYARVYGNTSKIGGILKPLFDAHMRDAGVGTISEMFQGDPPHRPLGHISYSCSVAELLRAHFQHITRIP